MTNEELHQKVLDLTQEWHDLDENSEQATYDLVAYVAEKLDITHSEAYHLLYGGRNDGALL